MPPAAFMALKRYFNWIEQIKDRAVGILCNRRSRRQNLEGDIMLRFNFRTASLSGVLILLFSGASFAENHFIFEMNGGAATDVGVEAEMEPGSSVGFTFGLGGRVPGQSPAYYAIARLGQSGFSYAGDGAAPPKVEHSQQEWAVGGRVYLPITDRFRVLAQAGVGQTFDEATVNNKAGDPALVLESSTWAIFTQAGLQFRVTEGFAIGMAADLALYPDHEDRDLAARAASVGTIGQLGRAQVGLTGTFHF
jgi:hypothetical protein